MNLGKLAEELFLVELKIKNRNKDFYALSIDDNVNPLFDIVSFEKINGAYQKTTYQVKEVDFSSENKAINGNFDEYKKGNIDYLVIVVFNSNNTYNKQPLILQIPFNKIQKKVNSLQNNLIQNGYFYYCDSGRTMSLNTLLSAQNQATISQYIF